MTPAGAAGEVDIVIVSWNSTDLVRACLQSVARTVTSDGVRLGRVMVVDNASDDGGLPDSPDHGLPLRIIRNRENLGFAAAVNQGAAAGAAPVVLLLNPDVELRAGSLRAPLAFLNRPDHGSYAAVGLRTYDPAGRTHRSCAYPLTTRRLLCETVGLALVTRFRGTGVVMRDWMHDQDRDVGHVIGACYAIRRSVLAALGGLDERYFVYMEDYDLSQRTIAAGWGIRFLAEPAVMHVGGGTSDRDRPFRLTLSLMARAQLACKLLPPGSATLVLVAMTVVEPVMRALDVLRAPSREGLRGLFGSYKLLCRWIFAKARDEPGSRLPPATSRTIATKRGAWADSE